MADRWIGLKKVKETEVTDEKTVGGSSVVKVSYEDGTTEYLAEPMFDKSVSDSETSLEALRDKRCQPVVAMLLSVFREWGVKMSEFSYVLSLLTKSLEYNEREALNILWSKWMPKPLTPEDVDFLTIDRVLKQKDETSSGDKE